MRPAQAAQVIPPMGMLTVIPPDFSKTSYPILTTASLMLVRVRVSAYSTKSFSLARFTVAALTPSIFRTVFSMRPAQAAQVIPPMLNV
jgi:hypothetical protein